MRGLIDRILDRIASCGVIESGTNNSWHYRKYGDGTYEATYTRQLTGVNVNNSGGNGEYYSGDIWFATRPSFAKTVDGAVATPYAGSMNGGLRVYRVVVDSSNVVRIVLRSPSSQTNCSCQVSGKIWGTY